MPEGYLENEVAPSRLGTLTSAAEEERPGDSVVTRYHYIYVSSVKLGLRAFCEMLKVLTNEGWGMAGG